MYLPMKGAKRASTVKLLDSAGTWIKGMRSLSIYDKASHASKPAIIVLLLVLLHAVECYGTRRGYCSCAGVITQATLLLTSLPNRQLHISAMHCCATQQFEKLIRKSSSQDKELRGQCRPDCKVCSAALPAVSLRCPILFCLDK